MVDKELDSNETFFPPPREQFFSRSFIAPRNNSTLLRFRRFAPFFRVSSTINKKQSRRVSPRRVRCRARLKRDEMWMESALRRINTTPARLAAWVSGATEKTLQCGGRESFASLFTLRRFLRALRRVTWEETEARHHDKKPFSLSRFPTLRNVHPGNQEAEAD